MSQSMSAMLVLVLLVLEVVSIGAATPGPAPSTTTPPPPPTSSLTVVNVPTGITTVLFGSQILQEIKCDVIPQTRFRVELTVLDGNGSVADPRLVSPHIVEFANYNPNNTTPVEITQQFTLWGRHEGRYYLTYQLMGESAALYRLKAASSVLSITEESQGWQGIWYELVFNTIIFVVGVSFFAWRRLHRVEIPIWTSHRAGLFERANFDGLDLSVFEKRYSDILGDGVRDRMRKYWSISCHGAYVCNTSGIPAALLMNFHKDAAHLCAILSFFALAMLPVNYLSGNSQTAIPGNSFQQTTISNVPLYSDWFWVHVLYCYIVAIAVMAFLWRQHDLLCTLRRRTKRIVGGRSILIHAGLPSNMNKKKLRAILTEFYPHGGIEEIAVVYDFSKLHHLLDRRRELAGELDRIRALDAGYEHGMLSCNLLWCPGSVMLPSPTAVLTSCLTCRPCVYHYRHHCRCCCSRAPPSYGQVGTRPAPSLSYSRVRSDWEVVDPRLAEEYDALDEELDFFPEEAIEMYANRRCVGAAFIIFDSTATRNDFIQLVREQSCLGRLVNRVENEAYKIRYGTTRARLHRPMIDDEVTTLAPYLSQLVLASAPEPDDVLWKNLQYEPSTVLSLFTFLARHITTTMLLLLFSTPTTVLVYIKLDSSSGIYRDLYAQHSMLVSLIATYLPSLLLIAVNWCLLAFLFYVTMAEPSISDSRRVKSFLIKGFVYLVISSIFLPSVGVTAAYLAFTEITTDDGRKSYVESFLYKISGTFFISYVCQRTFLGSIIELTRMAERLAYQPWVHSRSVTSAEQLDALKPFPYYYGHDYAMLLSVLLVILLGTVVTPILTPFGALFFYIKYMTVKYNFLYVIPYTPGRGHIAQTAYTLVFVCVIIFELVMAFVLLQIAGQRQFVAMFILFGATCAFYFLRIADMSTQVKQSMTSSNDMANATLAPTAATPIVGTSKAAKAKKSRSSMLPTQISQALSFLNPPSFRRTVFSPSPSNLEQDLGLMETYTDPYKVALSIFKLLGVNEFHRMSNERTQLRYAFQRLKRNMRMHSRQHRASSSPTAVTRQRWTAKTVPANDDEKRRDVV